MESFKLKLVLSVCAIYVAAVSGCSNSPVASGYVGGDEADASLFGPRGDAAAGGDNADPADGGASATGWTPFLKGALAVESRGCPQCHQSTNPDDGVLSGQSSPVPGTRAFGANLTPDPDTGIGGFSEAQLLQVIRRGTNDANEALCSAMPRYPDISDEEGAAIVAYLRGIRPVSRTIPSSECGPDLDGGASDAIASADGGASGDASAGADGGSCAGFVAPNVRAACHACLGRPCQANGCFGAYYCDTSTWTCHPEPPGCK
jgi:hypothetical protein